MRAIVLEKFGGLDSLVYKEIPDPEPKTGHVVIEVKAFGRSAWKIKPAAYCDEQHIIQFWDDILRFIATIKLGFSAIPLQIFASCRPCKLLGWYSALRSPGSSEYPRP